MDNSSTQGIYQPETDLTKAKSQILTGKLPEQLFMDKKHQFIALQLFRAVDILNFRGVKSQEIVESAQHLRRVQEDLLNQNIDQSLEMYSEGFVLGALVDGLHRFEANIHTTEEYNSVLGHLRTWREKLNESDLMSKFVDDALQAAEELLNWNEERSRALLPIGLDIIGFFEMKEDPDANEVLEYIIEAREEKEVFHFLAGALKTKPPLHKTIFSKCIAHKINPETFSTFLEQLMEQLKTSAKEGEVRGLAGLFWAGYSATDNKALFQKDT
ncbi:MAG: hypothetical protein ACFFB3_19185 [Candidatus Hodarchaeota archaeon]